MSLQLIRNLFKPSNSFIALFCTINNIYFNINKLTKNNVGLILGYIRPLTQYKFTNAAANYSNDGKNTGETDEVIPIANPFKREERKCILCVMNIIPDYKNIRLLSQFQSPYTGRIYGRHITGLCERKQKRVETEIKKAQECGYMPYYFKTPEFLADPRLYDPENPIRPHKY